jgi:hypothetical protein
VNRGNNIDDVLAELEAIKAGLDVVESKVEDGGRSVSFIMLMVLIMFCLTILGVWLQV